MNFEYKEPTVPENCTFKISPSNIEKFFTVPSVWYDEQILGNVPFKGNTATTLGTVCHAIYDAVAKKESTTREEINTYLTSEEIKNNPDIDIEEVQKLYPEISKVVVNEYLLQNTPDKTEFEVCAKVLNNIYVAGTCDNFTKGIVVDYKTVSSLPAGDAIPFKYKIQLLAYAYALRSMGVFVDRIRIVYGIKPLKTIGARCLVQTQQITEEDWILIQDTLKLIAETVETSNKYPELRHLLFKSMKLKV